MNSHVCFYIQSCNMLFGLIIWGKYTLSQVRDWKREKHFNSLFISLWIFFFDIHWLSARNSFFKVCCNVVSETVSMNFSFFFYNKILYLAFLIDLWPRYNFIISWISLRKYWFTELCRSPTFHWQYQQMITIVNITIMISSEVSLSIGNLLSLSQRIYIFQNSNFPWKLKFYWEQVV